MIVSVPKVTCCLMLSGMVFAFAANADTVQLSAATTYSVDGSSNTTISQSTPANAQPSVLESTGSTTSSQNGRAKSQLGGQLFTFGSRSQGDGVYSDSSSAFYGQSFTAAARGRYTFDFTITGGGLSVYANAPTTGGTQTAALTGLITERLNGGAATTLFDYRSSLSETGRGVPVFQESGAKLNPSGATLGVGSGSYQFLLYTGSLDLGVLAQGDQVQIAYTLGTAVSGTGTQCGARTFARPAIVVGPGDSLGCAGAVAANLDPAGVGGPVPGVTFTPVPVSEPGGAGVAVLAGLSLIFAARAGRTEQRTAPLS